MILLFSNPPRILGIIFMKKKRKKESEDELDSREIPIKKETLQSVLAIVFFVLSIFLLLASFGKAGLAGDVVRNFLSPLMGWGYFILPILLIILGIAFLLSIKKSFAWMQGIGALFFFLSGLGLLELILPEKGGSLGRMILDPIKNLFQGTFSAIILFALLIISTLIIFDSALRFQLFFGLFNKLFKKKEIAEVLPEVKMNAKETETTEEPEKVKEEKILPKKTETPKNKTDEFSINLNRVGLLGKLYEPPPLSLLSKDQGKPGVGDIKANSNIIKRTLKNFGIDVEMDEVTIGPTVTRYALKPAEGVKVSRILSLQNDLSLALAAHPIRVEAPIPGKSLVGIEIPNSVKTIVGLGNLLAEETFQKSSKSLLISLGKAISGKSHFGDLAKMPHLLIAGATGSGKSVAIHAIITSLLYRNSPESLKFILIDPKRVELTLYNKIPHLLTPVLTDPKKSVLALKWAAKEMDRRYDVLEQEKVRDISSYHKNVLEPKLKKMKSGGMEEGADIGETMPYIVIIIDELADMMSSYPRELEATIVRLAQMSRAVGIHLILSTQRPSVNVITGLIKANVPTRIALQVASQIDSRTILDMSGAEKLLGAGDMLYLSAEMSKPERVQSAYITESEVKDVVKYLIDNYKDVEGAVDLNLDTATNAIEIASDEEDDDELYEEARELVIAARKASTSYLQRRLKVGYARAARLIDLLEERGVVGAGEGAKPREVLGNYPEQTDIGLPKNEF